MVHDAAGIDEEQRVTHLAEFGEDVRGDEDGFSFLRQNADEVFEFHPGPGVEAGGGLVHDEDLWVMQEGPAKAETLGHALGELVGETVSQGDEVRECHHLLDAAAAFVAGVAERAGVEIEVFEHCHVLVVPEMIWHPSDEGAHLVGVVDHVDATDLGGTHGGIVEGGEHAHGRGLARSICTHESAHRAVRNVEGHSVDGLEGAEVAEEVADGNGDGHGKISDFRSWLNSRWGPGR